MERNAKTEKRLAAEASLDYVQPGMKLGLGTGSTAELMVRLLAERVREGLDVAAAVPTSRRTESLGRELGLPMATLDEHPALDLTIDGADEADPRLNLIKGGGGALLREKIVAAASRQLVVIADSTKLVETLGAFRLPVEVIPFALRPVLLRLQDLGARTQLRAGDDKAFMTDESNYIVDCDFGPIEEPERLGDGLSSIPGVVEHGLFTDLADVVIVGRGDRVEMLRRQV